VLVFCTIVESELASRGSLGIDPLGESETARRARYGTDGPAPAGERARPAGPRRASRRSAGVSPCVTVTYGGRRGGVGVRPVPVQNCAAAVFNRCIVNMSDANSSDPQRKASRAPPPGPPARH